MPAKTYEGHVLHVLPGTHHAHCRLCGGSGTPGGPSSLTSECPGEPIKTEYLNKIYQGKLDYLRGKWVSKNAAA